MTQFDGELSPPFEIVEPAAWRAPIIFNSPHSGSIYPDEFLNASRIDLVALRRSEDSFMDELIGDLSELLCRRQSRTRPLPHGRSGGRCLLSQRCKQSLRLNRSGP